MPRPKKPLHLGPTGGVPKSPLGILELERFSQENLSRWTAFSNDLDELQAALFFGVQPEQRRIRHALIAALQELPHVCLPMNRWVRIVTYQYSMAPLSAAGSLYGYGGRFNPGTDLDHDTLSPFPALYIAEDPETAFREKFQLRSSDRVDGLTPQELALSHASSYSTLAVNGEIKHVLDLTSARSLEGVAKVFGRIKMPQRARELGKRLRISPKNLRMITTGRQLHDAVLTHNWRMLPAQFGLPAAGHTLAELIRAAGFEAILYRSTKGSGRCVAVFPDMIGANSFVELADASPAEVKYQRLDQSTGDELAGWESLPTQKRPR